METEKRRVFLQSRTKSAEVGGIERACGWMIGSSEAKFTVVFVGDAGRRYALHCTETGVELVGQRDPVVAAPPAVTAPASSSRSSPANSGPRRRVDDEGFESDDSASEASSCCLVNDHVFAKAAVAPMASTNSDSANSSGASDTDEPDPAAAAAAGSSPLPPRETFTFQDVVFCHVDPGFPRNLVLVVRRSGPVRRNRSRDDGADVNIPAGNTGSLEALIFECTSEENVRRLCSKYQELNRRVRLESRFRRKDLTALQPPVTEPRFNLQRTDLDGVTHITVALAAGLNTDDAENDVDGLCGPSSIISISTPDVGNILEQSVTTSRNRTRIHKEIDGVIRADVEPSTVSTLRRQRFEKDDVTISPPSPTPPEPAPLRPERRRFLRKLKNNPAPQPPPTNPRANSVLRGQFVRVSVDPASTPSPPPPPPPPPTWLNHFPAGWVNQPAPPRGPPEPWNRDVISYPRQHPRRSRSSDAGRNHARTRSPPAPARRPMAYRYVDTPPPPPSNSLSNRFFGLSQKIRELGTSVVGNPTHISAHRRNSWGDSPSRFYTSLEPQPPSNTTTTQSGHLRSIVKNNKRNVGESQCNHEPKKVTFSAFATVQVMK